MARYRGVNLSGWLVPEPWITPELFAVSSTSDEASLKAKLGQEAFDERIKEHRDSFITEKDFTSIARRGYNAVRLPVPWYVFGEAGPLPGNYKGCISYVDRAIGWAEAEGIEVLLDIASAPSSSLSADGLRLDIELNARTKDALITVACALAMRYKDADSFLGIEVIDEVSSQKRKALSLTEGTPRALLRNFYRESYDAIRSSVGKACVIVFSDAGQPKAWQSFLAHVDHENVWLDTHPYRHMDRVDATGPSGARLLAARTAHQVEQAKTSKLPVMVGEFSAALPAASSIRTREGRIATERIYVASQLQTYEQCEAWFFQTWKTDERIGGWDARTTLATFEKDMLD